MNSVESFVFKMHGVQSEKLYEKNRRVEIVLARFVAYYLLSEVFGLPAAAIGREFGMDHTSVLHGVKKIKADKEVEQIKKAFFLSYPHYQQP